MNDYERTNEIESARRYLAHAQTELRNAERAMERGDWQMVARHSSLVTMHLVDVRLPAVRLAVVAAQEESEEGEDAESSAVDSTAVGLCDPEAR